MDQIGCGVKVMLAIDSPSLKHRNRAIISRSGVTSKLWIFTSKKFPRSNVLCGRGQNGSYNVLRVKLTVAIDSPSQKT